jgi:hypothetical protein
MLNKFRLLRDNSESYKLVNDINNEFLAHQWADGSPFGVIANVTTNNGSTYPSNYAHLASGIFLESGVFSTIPQTANNVQLFAEFVDSSSLLLLGGRIQNLYANGVSRNSRSSNLLTDGYGQSIVPPTLATTFLRKTANVNQPVDDIFQGDDIVQFTPAGNDGYVFVSEFAAVKPGDILRVNYGTIEVDFIILEKKYISISNTFIVRINGKNLLYTTTALASVNRSLDNNNKYGVLAMAPVINTGLTDLGNKVQPSLIIGAPRGAQVLGVNFDPDSFDNNHYLLYLELYPGGTPSNSALILPAIDVTGNAGSTPGKYTLNTICNATNAAFRAPGFNYRFIAFQYQGEFGIMLADSYNNASFSIVSVILNSFGIPDPVATHASFPNNVIGILPTPGSNNPSTPDPLGFGPFGANVASPPYQSSYPSSSAALQPTKLFVPLRKNNYYVDGVEKEQMSLDVGQVTDSFGDGYWEGTVINVTQIGGRVQVTYNINLDLSTSQLKAGKTLVVQSLNLGGTFPTDFGRYIIQDVSLECPPSNSTQITVYDAVHGIGSSDGYATHVLPVGSEVGIYFNSSSVSFDAESATDFTGVSPFKRYFEVFIDEEANTFTHERGRVCIGATINNINSPPSGIVLLGNTNFSGNLNLVSISPKLRGYQFGNITKITLNLIDFTTNTGVFDGYLCAWNATGPMSNIGSTVTGKQGQITRFYDETNVDYIDINLDFTNVISSFTNQQIDIQLFPSLFLDEQVMIVGSCQTNDSTQVVNYLTDLRQFGNTSEEQLTTSALDYIAAPTQALQENGIIRGFDLVSLPVIVFTALTGNFGVVYSSNSVAATISQVGLISTNSIVSFISQPGVNYTVSTVSIDGFTITLTTNYLGTTNTTTTATLATTFPNNITFNGGEAVVNGKIIQLNNQSINIPVVQELIAPFSSQIPNSTITWFLCVNDESELELIASTDFNPTGLFATTYLANGAENRLFYVVNQNSATPTPYAVRGTYFSDLIQNQKNVTPIGVITAIVTAPGTFYSLTNVVWHDARRFIYNGYGGLGLPFIFGPEASFRTFDSLNTWLNQLTNFQSAVDNQNSVGLKVIVKGNTTLTSTTNLSYGQLVIFEGDGGTITIASNRGFTLGNNVIFNNVRFNYTFNPVGDGTYITTQLSNTANAAIYCEVDPVNGNQNLGFNKCIFTSANQYRYAFIGFNFSASTCYAQNISITGNRFETSFTGDDLLAVITFAAPKVSQTTNVGARLNNCVIANNYCNKNQLILIAPPLEALTFEIRDLIAATNVNISGNTCGAINVMVKQDYGLNIPNISFDLDKPSAGVIISQNTCRYIYSGFADGNFVDTEGSGLRAIFDVQSGFNLLVGDLAILNNNVSWIHTGYRQTTITDSTPTLIIRENKFTAYNLTYLAPYFQNVIPISSMALIVDKVVGT